MAAGTPETRSPQPPGTLRIGRVAGVDVLVRSSWLVVAVLIAVLMAPRVEAVEPGLGPLRYVAGLAFAVLLYLSVLLHEIAHAVTANRYGLGVRSISLNFLGGATEIDSETRTPGQEFTVAVVGPVTSLAVGLAALGLRGVAPGGLLGLAVAGLAGANLVVGVLNLAPGLPLDGGRMVRAVVWSMTGNQHRGTIAAAWGGRILAVLVLLWPVIARFLLDQRPDVVDVVLAAVLAAFLWSGASASMANARVRRLLPGLRARQLARPAVLVGEGMSVREAVERARGAGARAIMVRTSESNLTGVVSQAALDATPEDRRPWVPVGSVARSIEEGLVLDADIAGEELIRAMAHVEAGEYVLREADGTILGVLATADVDRAFQEGIGT